MVNFAVIGQISLFPLFGFVFAAVLSHAAGLLYGDEGIYHYRFHNRFALLTSFCIAMFAGPYLTTRHVLNRYSLATISIPKLAIFCLIVGVWSFCAGITIVQWLMLVGLINLP